MLVRYGVSTWVYGEEPLDVSLARLACAGYDGVELPGSHSEMDVADTLARCRHHGLAVLSVCGIARFGDHPDLSGPDTEEAAAALAYFKKLCDIAAWLGAGVVIVTPVPVYKLHPTGWSRGTASGIAAYGRLARAEYERVVEALRDLARHGASRGVQVGVEPLNRHESYLVNTVEEGIRLVRDVGEKSLGLHLDSYHMNIEETDPVAATGRVAGMVTSVHVADSNRYTPGTGHFDFGGFLAALAAGSFDGPVVVEALPRASSLDVAVQRWDAPARDASAAASVARLRALEVR